MEITFDMKADNQSQTAVLRLAAIAHQGRLALLRRLIQAGPEGLNAGELARFAQLNAPTASAQLLVLRNAELIRSHRVGRQIIYQANYAAMTELLSYLMEDCCGGDRSICEPLAAKLGGSS